MTTYMPVVQDQAQIDQAIANLDSAALGIGSGVTSEGTFMKVDDRTGAVTFGPEGLPVPPDERYVVGLHNFRHGYIDMQGGRVVDRQVVAMSKQPVRPEPPGKHYGTYEGGGPRNVDEIVLHGVDRPGDAMVFTAWGKSSANRIGNLLREATAHRRGTPEGQQGFIHPVILVSSSWFQLQARTLPDGTHIPARKLHHFDYKIVDWLHADGKTLLSQGQPAPKEEPAPWDDEATEDELAMFEAKA